MGDILAQGILGREDSIFFPEDYLGFYQSRRIQVERGV